MGVNITQGDAVAWARNYDGPLFHAMLCDPPYHLTSIVKRFGGSNAAPAQFGKDGAFARASKGFMGKQWDGGDVAFDPATWDAFASVLYPGAFGVAFASSRGWHRLAVAIEDAGLIIHPSIFGWAYGSGFPKATRVDTQIDKINGRRFDDRLKLAKYLKEKREALNLTRAYVNAKLNASLKCEHFESLSSDFVRVPSPTDWIILKGLYNLNDEWDYLIDRYGAEREVIGQYEVGVTTGQSGMRGGGEGDDITAPATDLAKAFAGYRYGLQALKPALEPIIVFQKPYEGRPIDNITQYGAGVLNIDGARIEYTNEFDVTAATPGNAGKSGQLATWGTYGTTPAIPNTQGRWPSNFILLDDGAAQALDRQSGHLESGQPMGVRKAQNRIYGEYGTGQPITGYGDEGGASRFFFQVQECIDAADPVYYCAKASTDERDAGLGEFDQKRGSDDFRPNDDGTHGIQSRLHGATIKGHNPHPTVKPISLARYLATLLLPPTEYQPRRLFIPFAGVASECIGAMQAGWDEIQGVELTEEYIPIANARVEYWAARGWQLDMFANSLLQSDVDV